MNWGVFTVGVGAGGWQVESFILLPRGAPRAPRPTGVPAPQHCPTSRPEVGKHAEEAPPNLAGVMPERAEKGANV